MKILVTADIHIKLGQKNVPKDWAINRYAMFFDQLREAEKEADLVIIPGDIFDRIPTIEELRLYFQFISKRTKPTILSTGNHEATKKGKSFFTELKEVTEGLNPKIQVVVDNVQDFDDFYVVPYEVIKKENTWQELDKKPIFTHVRGAIPPHVKPEIPLNWLKPFPVVFAGDLHSHSNTQENIIYPGSPMTITFHRERVKTGYLLIDTDNNWIWEWKEFNLPQLIRKTVSDPSQMVPTDFDHTIYELEGNVKELSGIDNELLDKKIIKRNSDTALILKPDMTLRDELEEYFRYVMMLEDEKDINKLLEVFDEFNHSQDS